jgi:hypothetical protein
VTNPKDFEQLKTLVAQIEARLSHLETSPFDLKKRPLLNLPLAVNPSDGVPLSQVLSLIAAIKSSSVVNNFSSGGLATSQQSLAYNSATQTIVASTLTPLTFNTNSFDTGIHSTSSNPTRFTITQAGTYACYSQVEWAANATSTRRALFILKNGSLWTTPTFEDNTLPSSLLNTNNHVFGCLQLVVGDYIQYAVSHDATVSITTIGNSTLGGLWRLGS